MLAKNPSQWDEQLEPRGKLTAHLPGRDKKEREDFMENLTQNSQFRKIDLISIQFHGQENIEIEKNV